MRMGCCFAGRCHVHMGLGAEVSVCVPAGRQTADHPIEREREKERGRESCTESCKGQVQYLKHISHLRRAAYCCGRVPMPQRDLKQQQQQDTTDSSNNKI